MMNCLGVQVSMGHGGKPWVADHAHANFEAAKKATLSVYGQNALMTREGGSIPITITFQEVTGKNVMLLPMGQSDDGAHSQNEKISKRNYIKGVSLVNHVLNNKYPLITKVSKVPLYAKYSFFYIPDQAVCILPG